MKTAIFDLDGTLLEIPNVNWKNKEFTWDNFMDEMDSAKVIAMTETMAKWHKAQGHRIIVVTARPCSYHERTLEHLRELDVEFDAVVSRPDWMCRVETEELQRGESSIESILHRHHAHYRRWVASHVDREHFSDGSYAYDDQKDNLTVWAQKLNSNVFLVENCGDCHIILDVDDDVLAM